MAKGIQDLGNGLGFIYVTDPSSNILKVYQNDADGARNVKLDGLKASAVGANRVATAIITIGTPTSSGAISNITVSAIEIIDPATPLNYDTSIPTTTLAQNIVNAINSYVGIDGGGNRVDFTAVRVGSDVYIFTEADSGDTYNGITPTIVHTGGLVSTVTQDFEGGSSSAEIYDTAIGYRFYLDADYGTTSCSGGGTATTDSIANAVEITNYIVNIGFQSAMPNEATTISSDSVIFERKGVLTIIQLTGEGSANDDLTNIIIDGAAYGDRILLHSTTDTITLNETGNINLQTNTYDVIGDSVIELVYSIDNEWLEVYRSTGSVGTTSDYRTAGFGIFSNEGFNTTGVSTSGTISFTANTDKKYQELTGSGSLSGNTAYQLNALGAIAGDEFWLVYDASVTVGAFSLSIFGVTLTAEQALNGGLVFYGRFLDGAWRIQMFPNLDTNATYPFKMATVNIADNAVTSAKASTNLKTDVVSRLISFEASEVGDMKMYMGYAGTVDYIHFTVDKAIAATDDGTIIPKNNAGTVMTSGTITVTASSTIGTGFTSTPTANNSFVAGDILTFTTAKTTAGGKGTLYIKITKA